MANYHVIYTDNDGSEILATIQDELLDVDNVVSIYDTTYVITHVEYKNCIILYTIEELII